MKVVVAPDSFKESVSAVEAAAAIARGVLSAAPSAEVTAVPVADGGEGTVEAILQASGGSLRRTQVHGPLGDPVWAEWGICGDGDTAVIEMAAASGLPLVPPERRAPLASSSRGTGQLVAAALGTGVRRIIVGLGGSATVDGGMGAAAALGVRFIDGNGAEIRDCCGARLADVCRLDLSGLDPRVARAEISVAADVTNPLLGPDGAARVYGPQKGASPDEVDQLERGLSMLAEAMERATGVDATGLPGAGAAGGMGAGFAALLGARIEGGARTVVEATRLRERAADSDMVITGEGRLDGQSAFGKATACVIGLAAELGVPVFALAGSLGEGYRQLHGLGLTAAFSIVDGPLSFEEARTSAVRLLAAAAGRLVRTWLAARR
jgi:glycerate kinase